MTVLLTSYPDLYKERVLDLVTKSRRKFQQLIDSGTLDIWAPLNFYSQMEYEPLLGKLCDCRFIEGVV